MDHFKVYLYRDKSIDTNSFFNNLEPAAYRSLILKVYYSPRSCLAIAIYNSYSKLSTFCNKQ